MQSVMKTLICAFVLTAVMSLAANANLVGNGDFEAGFESWHSGASDGGYVGIADDNGPSAPGQHCAYLSTEGVGGKADIRSDAFALDIEWTDLIYSFDYKVDKSAADGPRYQLRFWEGPGDQNWLGELNIVLSDTDGQWAVESGSFDIPEGAGYADIRISANIFEPFEGVAQIDNVMVIPEPATFALLGLGSVVLLRRRRLK